MTISSINNSAIGYYDTLTSPFLSKMVSINAYTPYDRNIPKIENFSKNYFPTIKSTTSTKLMIKKYNVGVIDGKTSSSASLVKNMIQNGYSVKNALDINKAVTAYGLNTLKSNGINILSTNEYEI